MKLHTKFFLAIVIVFLLLGVVVVVASINWINTNTIKVAQDRVNLHIKAARDIYEESRIQIRSSLDILAQSSQIRDYLKDRPGFVDIHSLKNEWQNIREKSGMDMLNLLDSDGIVLFRSRPPYNSGDDLSHDPQIAHVIKYKMPCDRDIILASERLQTEGAGLRERCLEYRGEEQGMLTGSAVPVIENGYLIGIIQMGTLLNGATYTVDKIRDGVFEDEQYKGKPIGTATIFMGDLRVSTNVVRSDGTRAIGMRVSQEVKEHVLLKGLPWTGKA